MRATPRDRLLFVGATGAGNEEPGGVEVSVGPSEAYLRIGGSAVFPPPVGTYLGLGSHRVETSADVTAPWVLVLPEGCQIKNTKPGESLCFAAVQRRTRVRRVSEALDVDPTNDRFLGSLSLWTYDGDPAGAELGLWTVAEERGSAVGPFGWSPTGRLPIYR